MSDVSNPSRPVPRWLHAWAVGTVAVTAVLLTLGGLVTTFRVGMADPIWPTTPWYLFVISWQEPSAGFLVEHSHRLAGYVVGCLVIVLAAGLWVKARANWLRWLGVAALAAVITQGLLGGFRVVLNAWAGTDLAALHGVLAQLVFSLFVCVAVLTAPRRADVEVGTRLRDLTLLLAGLAFLQLVWGAALRHVPNPLVQRGHLLTAFAVVGVAAWLVRAALADPAGRPRLGTASRLLVALLAVQVLLGVEAWMGKFSSGGLAEAQAVTPGQAVVRTAHVLVGTGVLATSVVLALLAHLPAGAAQSVPLTIRDPRHLGETA